VGYCVVRVGDLLWAIVRGVAVICYGLFFRECW